MALNIYNRVVSHSFYFMVLFHYAALAIFICFFYTLQFPPEDIQVLVDSDEVIETCYTSGSDSLSPEYEAYSSTSPLPENTGDSSISPLPADNEDYAGNSDPLPASTANSSMSDTGNSSTFSLSGNKETAVLCISAPLFLSANSLPADVPVFALFSRYDMYLLTQVLESTLVS